MSHETSTTLAARITDSPSPFLGFDLDSATRRDFTLRIGTRSGKVFELKTFLILNLCNFFAVKKVKSSRRQF